MGTQIDGFVVFMAGMCAAGFTLGLMTRMRATIRAASFAVIAFIAASPLSLLLVDPGSGTGFFFAVMAYVVEVIPFLLSVAWGARRKGLPASPAR